MGTPQDVTKGLDLFRTLVFDPIVEAAIVEFEGPVRTIPIIGEIMDQIEHDFCDLLYNKLGQQIILSTIIFVNLEHRKAFNEASIGLEKIALEKGVDSKEFKDAHEKEKQALKKFGQFSVVKPGLIS